MAVDDEPALARVGQHLTGQVGGAVRGLGGLLDVRTGRGVRRDLPEGHVEVGQDRHQQVVEVVGDAPGQDAQALELLGVEQPPLQLQALLIRSPALDHLLLQIDGVLPVGPVQPGVLDGEGGEVRQGPAQVDLRLGDHARRPDRAHDQNPHRLHPGDERQEEHGAQAPLLDDRALGGGEIGRPRVGDEQGQAGGERPADQRMGRARRVAEPLRELRGQGGRGRSQAESVVLDLLIRSRRPGSQRYALPLNRPADHRRGDFELTPPSSSPIQVVTRVEGGCFLAPVSARESERPRKPKRSSLVPRRNHSAFPLLSLSLHVVQSEGDVDADLPRLVSDGPEERQVSPDPLVRGSRAREDRDGGGGGGRGGHEASTAGIGGFISVHGVPRR